MRIDSATLRRPRRGIADSYTAALTLLSRRELSSTQLRQRLARRKFSPHEIEDVVPRLTRDGTLDDRRVALASARVEAPSQTARTPPRDSAGPTSRDWCGRRHGGGG